MSQPIHPLEATQRLQEDYARYLRTIYFFRDQSLRDQFWQALREPSFLVRGPILESSPPFKQGRSIAQLVATGILHSGFRQLCSEGLPFERPLYLHQDQAISKVVSQGRNVVVATGTGSGKTETFLIPIFDHLLRQRQSGELRQPGVRALLLYPMNALVNDQLKRLRQYLTHFPDITFGRYTGETKESDSQARSLYLQQFGTDPLPNELISRDQMRSRPPHILITNYAMLEYLLLRPKDSEFFDGSTGRFWRFLVLDEAHVYDGASGIEIGMLLRRVKDRVVRSEPGRLRCLATSATLGQGEQGFPDVARFASEVFGETFEPGDVVAGQRESMALLSEPWGEPPLSLYPALDDAILRDESTARLAEISQAAGVPLDLTTSDLDTSRFLYTVLRGDRRLHRLRDSLKQPALLNELAQYVDPQALEPEPIVHLVWLAARARPDPEALSLLPARYHVFARALEGAFVCLNVRHPAHAAEAKPTLFLSRHEECPHCQSRVFELATCPRCGTAYVVGREEQGHGHDLTTRLRHPLSSSDDIRAGLSYFVLQPNLHRPDEDEAVFAGEPDTSLDATRLEPHTLCLGCGAVEHGEGRPGCDCPDSRPSVVVQRVSSESPMLQQCVSCGARSPNGVVYRFLTGQDAPVSVLATSLYQMLPEAEDEKTRRLPGQGRKLLAFADSRQDAAFFAPYLERTYEQILRRRLIHRALSEDPDGCEGHLRLDDVVSRVVAQSQAGGLFGVEEGLDARRTAARLWLMQEFLALDARYSLEGQGLLRYRLVRPSGFQPPELLLVPPWQLGPGEAWVLLEQLLTTLRQQGAVSFPPNVDPRDDAFKPRNFEYYVRDCSAPEQHIFGWLPRKGGNRRLEYLVQLLQHRSGLSPNEAERVARDTLTALWRYLTEGESPWLTREPQVQAWRLNYRLWEWVPVLADTPVYRCSRCFTVMYENLDGVCPSFGCDGTLERMDPRQPWEADHYRHLYQTMETIALRSQEHTAQWTPTMAGEIQTEFIDGKVNVLSCSTTFELGVDVGTLQAVLMRNVPPSTANYVQRAGRAGRRTDSVAFVLTYAQRRSHDLTQYNQPLRMVGGQVQPPVVVVDNDIIVRRHVQSVVVAAFLRWAAEHHNRTWGSVGPFFDPTEGAPTGPDLLRTFIHPRPEELLKALLRIVPERLHARLELQTWGWLQQLTNADRSGSLDLAETRVRDELQTYERLMLEAFRERKANWSRYVDYLSRVQNTVRNQELLGFLGANNVLPKYGFPTDVVELQTRHVPLPEAQEVELQRDLKVAISEYAPGSEVVAAKRIWTGAGLYVIPGQKWRTFHYAVCPECGRFHRSIEPLDAHCTVPGCGGNLFGFPRRYGEFLIPAFGFVASRDEEHTRRASDRRPQRTYASRVYFADYAEGSEAQQPDFTVVSELSHDGVAVRRRYSRYGKLARVNGGILNAGFRICMDCGWAEPVPQTPSGNRRRNTAHTNPRTGKDCRGRLETYHLGHEFMTDVLEIRFTGPSTPTWDDSLWLSTLYALLEGASEALSISRDDLDGTLYPYQTGQPPALILFDNVPGGAGHVRRVAEALPRAVQAAWERVARCECGAETSCYECLRNYGNQFVHDKLKRGLARDFLAMVREG